MYQQLRQDPFADFCIPDPPRQVASGHGFWPASWIAGPTTSANMTAYRLRFSLPQDQKLRLHVSADEWADLYLDGQYLARVPDLSEPRRWFYTTLQLHIPAGKHCLSAVVYHLGHDAPAPVTSVATGLLLCPDPDSPWVRTLATGKGLWQYKNLKGLDIGPHGFSHCAAGDSVVDTSQLDFDALAGKGRAWRRPEAFEVARSRPRHLSGHPMSPSILPPRLDRERTLGAVRHVGDIDSLHAGDVAFDPTADLADQRALWEDLAAGRPVTIPAHTRQRVLLDMEDYLCGRPSFRFRCQAPATLRFRYAEALRTAPFASSDAHGDWLNKSHRDAWQNMFFHGAGDTFKLSPDQRVRRLTPYWWRAGRYLELTVETTDAPLEIHGACWRESRYPLEMESKIRADSRLSDILPFCIRALQSCAHESYMDCPYYEQLQWVGDMRPQILCTFAMTGDTRLPQKALLLAADSARDGYLTRANFPIRGGCVIPAFSLAFVSSVYDYALWRGDVDFIRELMCVCRHNMEIILSGRGDHGLARFPPGWPYFDWAPGWEMGIPPHADRVNALFNWQLVCTLDQMAALETYVGESNLAARCARKAQELTRRSIETFWDPDRGAFADTASRYTFSQHAQCMAILSGRLSPDMEDRCAQALISDADLTPCQPFFSHYVFEALTRTGRIDALLSRLDSWHDMLAQGLRTTPEVEEGTRSDCHAWSAHPVYHALASVAGIRPGAMGFTSVHVRPQLGSLKSLAAEMPSPAGPIRVDFTRHGQAITGSVELPGRLSGTLEAGGRQRPLQPGLTHLS